MVLLTSIVPDEGKSTLALSLGRLGVAEGLRVHPDVMARRVQEAGDLVLSEWRGLTRDLPTAPAVPDAATAHDYLGASRVLTDDIIRRWRGRTDR